MTSNVFSNYFDCVRWRPSRLQRVHDHPRPQTAVVWNEGRFPGKHNRYHLLAGKSPLCTAGLIFFNLSNTGREEPVKSAQHLLPERSRWTMAKGWQRYQRCGPRMRANVRPLRWQRLTARWAEGCAHSGGRSGRCEGGSGRLGSDRNSQRACPRHAPSARSEVVVGGWRAWLKGARRAGNPRTPVGHIYWSVVSEHASQFLQ